GSEVFPITTGPTMPVLSAPLVFRASMPRATVVVPVYELPGPWNVNWPVPALVRLPAPVIRPLNVVLVLSRPTVSVLPAVVRATVPKPASEPIDVLTLRRSRVAPVPTVTAVRSDRRPPEPSFTGPALMAV